MTGLFSLLLPLFQTILPSDVENLMMDLRCFRMSMCAYYTPYQTVYNTDMSTWKEAIARQISIKMILAEILRQLGCSRSFTARILGLSKHQIHIIREREKMTRNLWYSVLKYYKWTCACCHKKNFYNQDTTTPKMEVDHIKPLWSWGYTEWDNLQVLCKPCNQRKGTKTIDYRRLNS